MRLKKENTLSVHARLLAVQLPALSDDMSVHSLPLLTARQSTLNHARRSCCLLVLRFVTSLHRSLHLYPIYGFICGLACIPTLGLCSLGVICILHARLNVSLGHRSFKLRSLIHSGIMHNVLHAAAIPHIQAHKLGEALIFIACVVRSTFASICVAMICIRWRKLFGFRLV